MSRLFVAVLIFLSGAAPAFAQRKLQGTETPRTTLPQEHPEQRIIRDFLAKLTEKDFTHGVSEAIAEKPGNADPEFQYRQHIYTLMPQPLVGTKRGTPAVNAPAKLFLLASLENSQGVMVPPVWPETLTSFVQWKYPGNPYYDNRALKLRAIVTAMVMMVLLDDQLEHFPERGGSRADWMSHQLVSYGAPYPVCKELLPKDVQAAYEKILQRMAKRVLEWGPKGEEPNMDIITTLGLWYASAALNDPAFSKDVEDYARRFFTNPHSFSPAGYFVDNRGIDMGYQGTTNYFATGVALASKWPFAQEAVAKCYRLRAHLCLPEPDGTYVGPSHFNSRTSSDAWGDQWNWNGARDFAASLLTDEAAYLVPSLALDELKKAPEARAREFRGQLRENPVNGKGGFLKDDELTSQVWKWRMWHSFNFPASVNYGNEFYPDGAYARRAKLEQAKSPVLKSPFLRDGSFLKVFHRDFVVTKNAQHAAIIHMGRVGQPAQDDGLFKFSGPLGFGGGQLSAFWTPTTGAVILGRRGGNSWNKPFDLVEEWRTWPIHAVSGTTLAGKVFTSGRIVVEENALVNEKEPDTCVFQGLIPIEQLGQGKVLEGRVRYHRWFRVDGSGVGIETRLSGDGRDKVAELTETIPVFLGESKLQPKATPTKIEFEVGGKWIEPTTEFREGVTAVRLSRFTGTALIQFEKPQRVKLSPTVWKDSYLSGAQCRNLMIDLLDKPDTPMVLKGERIVKYRVTAGTK